MAEAVDPATRKKVLRVVFISLLLDLISFTFILPLFPKLLEFYRSLEPTSLDPSAPPTTVLSSLLYHLNNYKNAFSRPISSKYDIVLLGGALGSLFSALQAIASPIIGTLSDKYGRRTALLVSMLGNIASVLLWCLASDFRTFLASRIVGGLSEGNVQLATAIAADISDEKQRGSTMAMVGACFSIAFTFGPALGAYLSTIPLVRTNPFATAAGVSLLLIVVETFYLYLYLPETHKPSSSNKSTTPKPQTSDSSSTKQSQNHVLLCLLHLLHLLPFSGLEFSLPFLTSDLFSFSPSQNGRLLGYVGLISALFQGGVTRRLPPLLSIRIGTLACLGAFAILAFIPPPPPPLLVAGAVSEDIVKPAAGSLGLLYTAATLLALTSATVVTGLNALCSLNAGAEERGKRLGQLRSWGQLGRAAGPIVFCTLYWWAGRTVAYSFGGTTVAGVVGVAWLGLSPGSIGGEAKKEEVGNGTQSEGKEL